MSVLNYGKKAIQAVVSSKKAFCRFLTANDTGKTGAHQAGIYIPKAAFSLLFDSPCLKGTNVDRWVSIKWQDDIITKSRFIYYGVSTRNEYRITNCGTRDYNPLAEENTGALLVLSERDRDNYSGWILNTDDEINEFLDAFGISVTETGGLINTTLIAPSEKLRLEITNFIKSAGNSFPTAEFMSLGARNIYTNVYDQTENIIKKPDQELIHWIEMEYELFRNIEEAYYGEQVRQGFPTMQSFIDTANSILNRRKSRAGKSLEFHLAALFEGNALPFESQVITEGNKRPDFVFPSGTAYHNLKYDSDKLIVLGAKTTCKDRWRQIINEADRVRGKNKYLCTLQQGISAKQLEEMKTEKVILVVPSMYIDKYPKEYRSEIMSLSSFIAFAKETLA